jgi:hypothetical protein
MTTDDELRDILRTVAEAPAPPATTTLERVVRRGRRRVLVQRGATVAAVIGVVAAIGVGGVLLRSATAGQDVRPAGTPLSPVSPSSSSPAPPPMKLLPGWTWAPMSITGQGEVCRGMPSDGHEPGSLGPVRPDVEDAVTARFVDVVQEQSGTEPTDAGWTPGHDILVFDFVRDGNLGIFELAIDSYGGTAEQAANADVAMNGNCDPPQRKQLADGTIVQLYPLEGEDGAARQRAAVYEPDGRYYLVSAGDIGGQGQDSYPEPGSRGPLPLDVAELGEVARLLAWLDV